MDPNSDTPELVTQIARASAHFEEHFGRRPRFAAVAPGRVNLIGEHVDYNGGFVLPMAIERQTLIVADRAPGRIARVVSTTEALQNKDGEKNFAEFEIGPALKPGQPGWANYVKGVVAIACRRGLDPGGFDAVIDSTVPLGGGLSSSAALEVSMATLVEELSGKTLPPMDKALLAQEAEHAFAGVPCGIMDQAISTLARADHALLLDCRSHETRLVPLRDPAVSVLIANTNVKHALTGGEYAERRVRCESAAKKLFVRSLRDVSPDQLAAGKSRLDADEFRRASHVVSEIARTLDAAEHAGRGDWPRFGRLLLQSHASLRDDYEVSCPELDVLVELASEMIASGDVIGSRMTGGGFGGCTVSLVRTDAVERVTRRLADGYRQRTGIDATIFATHAAGGARKIALD